MAPGPRSGLPGAPAAAHNGRVAAAARSQAGRIEMSRLADKMKRAGRVEPAPIGFGAPPGPRAAAPMVCPLGLEKDEAKKVAQAAAAADAVIITGADSGKLADLLKKLGDVPAGLRLEDGQRTSVAAAREARGDFVG